MHTFLKKRCIVTFYISEYHLFLGGGATEGRASTRDKYKAGSQ